jgi:hypothetical protein
MYISRAAVSKQIKTNHYKQKLYRNWIVLSIKRSPTYAEITNNSNINIVSTKTRSMNYFMNIHVFLVQSQYRVSQELIGLQNLIILTNKEMSLILLRTVYYFVYAYYYNNWIIFSIYINICNLISWETAWQRNLLIHIQI